MEAAERSNADRLKAAFEALEGGDYSVMRPLYADDVELWSPASAQTPDSGLVRGAEAVDAWYAQAFTVWRDVRFGITDMVERGPFVVVFGEFSGFGLRSGLPFAGRFLAAYTFRAGRVISIAHHWGVET